MIGKSWAPVTKAISTVRRARMFHPEGIVGRGTVEAVAGPYEALGERLAGPVLARCSAALWKGAPRWFDVLGIALRFGEDQDLLFATIRSPFTMAGAPVTTRTDDFLANRYWAVSPFEVEGVGRVKFRLTPETEVKVVDERDEALRRAIEAGGVVWRLEARRVYRRRYEGVARVVIERMAPEVDEERLRFDPYRAGRGIVPSGLVHAIRPAAYAGSQRGRAEGMGG